MTMVPKALAALALLAALAAAGCGTDEIAPGNPSTENALPDIVFFNLTGDAEVVTLRGTASDNVEVKTVDVSFDNGASWDAADVDTSAPYTMRSAAWAYAATVGDLPGATNTLLIRVTDGTGNETMSDPFTVRKMSGSTPANLVGAIGSAAAGEVVALSSGTGAAYDFSGTSSVILIDRDLTLIGNGYGAALPAVACTPRPPSGRMPATVLSAGTLHPRLLSVEASLSLSDVCLQGGINALVIADVSGTNIRVAVTDCLFKGQAAWAIQAADGGSAADTITLALRGCQVNAQDRQLSARGGVLAKGVILDASDSSILLMQDTGGPDDPSFTGAGLWIEGGGGRVTECCFERNMVAITASGSSVVVSSCQVLGNLLEPTWGIDLRGAVSTPVLRRNTISGNTNFGLRIGGRSLPYLRHNVIAGNEGGGIIIDFVGSSSDVDNIDLGKSNVGDEGRNDLFDNTHPDGSFQIYVTDRSTPGTLPIPALWNYWGIDIAGNISLVRSVVYDGRDNPGRSIVNNDQYFASRQN